MEKRHRYKKYDLKTKVAALDYLKNHSLEQTARTFQVDPKRIRDWRKDGSQIREQAGANSGAARKRLRGGGRKPRDKILEERLRDQILLHRENRLRVSRTNAGQENGVTVMVSSKPVTGGYRGFCVDMAFRYGEEHLYLKKSQVTVLRKLLVSFSIYAAL